jgi:predicted SAM-dependent methyltransferase
VTNLPERQTARQPRIEEVLGVERVDIGCGAPHERHEGCFGIDLNPGYRPDLVWDCDLGLPFADASLSFVNADNSLEHFHHPFFVVEEIHRCLRPGGRLRVVVPNVQHWPVLLLSLVADPDRYFTWYMSLPRKKIRTIHRTLFTRHAMQRMVREAGLVVTRTRGLLYAKEICVEAEKPGGSAP